MNLHSSFIKVTLVAGMALLVYVPIRMSATSFKPPQSKAIAAMNMKQEPPVYRVTKLTEAMPIDAHWDKPQWRGVSPIEITNYVGELPAFRPKTEAKMMYDDENVYIIFRVKDRYVHSVVQEYNGNVSGDACVEFFFSPDTKFPERYFNLEINAGGTPLMFYITQPWTAFTKLEAEDIKKIEIAHSLPKVVDPEIAEPITWTIEYRVPLSMLEQFSEVSRPEPGTVWKANFYKTASQSSNPHWVAWSAVDRKNFHLPQFFGTLTFQ